MNDLKDPLYTPRLRYETDPQFRSLVQTIEALINRAEFTPSELREAVILAHINYENQNLRRVFIPVAEIDAIDGLKAIDKFLNGTQE